MAAMIEIVPERPYEEGVEQGRQLGKSTILARTGELLQSPYRCDTLGAMAHRELVETVRTRLQTPPDYSLYPELEDLYPERMDYLRGLANGAECTLDDAVIYSYLTYRDEIDTWYHQYQLQPGPLHCSGVFLKGPDGVLGGHSMESEPPPCPPDFRHRKPALHEGTRVLRPTRAQLKLKKPRTGYIEGWGVSNEKGVGCLAAVSCGVLLDEPIEDTWPIGRVPLLRFARNVDHLAELYRRYNLFNWGRESLLFADIRGNAMVVEKSFRRIGIRMLGNDDVLWCTEGYFESSEMNGYLRARRREYLERTGKHLGCEDMQYATDCGVRFTHIGELCYQPWGKGYDHMRRILGDHSPFPRAVCRHGGPDTAAYDRTVTQCSIFRDVTHNRSFERKWVPWKKYCCEVPEEVVQYPHIPA
ncbi:MAG: C45 family peptidase [Armatimonadota bacterium]